MSLTNITITGADDGVDPRDLMALSAEFPFVEWAILFSAKRFGEPRYPSVAWVLTFAEIVEASWTEWRRRGDPNPPDYIVKLAAHLCGQAARATQSGRSFWLQLLKILKVFQRVQLNGFDITAPFDFDAQGFSYIIQVRNEQDLVHAEQIASKCYHLPVALFDASGGRGIAPSLWPKPPKRLKTGYAGGIGPDNIGDVIATLDARDSADQYWSDYWLDMETGVRDGQDRLDLDRVRRVLECAKKSIGKTP